VDESLAGSASGTGHSRTLLSAVVVVAPALPTNLAVPPKDLLVTQIGDGRAFFAFSTASSALLAVESLLKQAPGASAAILTGEFELEGGKFGSNARSLLLDAVAIAEPGQILASLPTVELSRTSLGDASRFEELGNYPLASADRVEKMYLLVGLTPKVVDARKSPNPGLRSTCFVGRSEELDDLRRLTNLSRLVSVIAPSGYGKTALIMRLREEVEEQYLDASITIDLSSIAHDDLVAPTVLRLLGIQKNVGGSNLDAIVSHLSAKNLLLILDSGERVLLGLRRLVDAVLQDCPNVEILVGTHKPLRLPAEARYRLKGLEVPSIAEDWRVIRDYDAIALFTDRAQLVDPDFRIDRSNADVVAALCHRLDGIPLAIELAASKVSILNPRQILDRMEDRFHLLKDRTGSVPKRKSGLWEAVAWSHSLLSSEARALLPRLAVFEGAFSIGDAEEVCQAPDLAGSRLISAFEDLADASFLVPSPEFHEKRFVLSETVRLFVSSQEGSKSVLDELRPIREAWCIRLLERASKEWNGHGQGLWLERVEAAYPDIRQTIVIQLRNRRTARKAVDLILHVFPYWFARYYLTEGLGIVQRAINQQGTANHPSYSRLINLGSSLASSLGDYSLARLYSRTSLRHALQVQDEHQIACAWCGLGMAAGFAGRKRSAIRCYVRAASIFRQRGDKANLMRALINTVVHRADLEMLEQGRQEFDEAVSLDETLLDPDGAATLHLNGARLLAAQGEYASAHEHLSTALERFEQLRNPLNVARCLRTAAHIFFRRGNYLQACQALAVASRVHASQSLDLLEYEKKRLDQYTQVLTNHLGPETFRRAWAEGQFIDPITVLSQQTDI
jgi:predicted ATPase